MSIWRPSVRKVLDLMLSSTDHKFYLSEIQKQTRLSRSVLCPLMNAMTETGWVDREKERPNMESFNRPLRTYYSLPADTIDRLRLEDCSYATIRTSA